MWSFSQKTKDLQTLPSISDPCHRWGIAEGDYDGSPLIVRFNNSGKEWCAHPGLPIKLGFAVPLNTPTENGLPESVESEQLSDIEDVIVREVQARTKGLHALVLSTSNMKEFVFYIPRRVDVESLHKAVQEAVPTHDVQCMAEKEVKWDSFTDFSPE